MLSNQIKNQHLMWRAGFGPAADQLEQLKDITPKQLYQALQNASGKKPAYMDVADNYLKGCTWGQKKLGGKVKKRNWMQKSVK